jgi:putative PIN family toxin of toxin-antitoxin system
MSRPRIVLDTNVLISAALKPSGLEAQLIELVAYRAVELCVSAEVLAEYRTVFSRPKFAHLDPDHVSRLLTSIAAEATAVTPTERLNISKHDDDNRFYECAAKANADYLVTGNEKHFNKPYKNTKIVNARQLFELLASGARD